MEVESNEKVSEIYSKGFGPLIVCEISVGSESNVKIFENISGGYNSGYRSA